MNKILPLIGLFCLSFIFVNAQIILPAPPADVNVQCAADVPAPVDLTAEGCEAAVTTSPSAVIAPGDCDNQFTMVRTWTFIDVCGNQGSVSQTINVNDTTPPNAPAPPADVNIQCAADVPAPVDLTANDNCDGDITVSPSAVITPGNCDNQFTMVRTWTFIDGCGNQSSVSQTIVVNDTTPPDAPAPPADVNVQCAADVPPPVDLTANDNCDGDITVSNSAVITPGNCDNQFTMVRTWTFIDGCGNQSSVSQTIVVDDTTPPDAPAPPADVNVQCAEDVPPPVDLTANDNCDGDITVSPSAVITPGNCDNQFTMVRTWTFIDGCGNQSSVSQTINVDDTTPPIFQVEVLPQDVTVNCEAPEAEVLTAFDICEEQMMNGEGPPPAIDPWINEIHYDNAGTDVGEFFEIAGLAGTDLTGFSVVFYNGNGGASYNPSVALSGILPDQSNGYGTLSFPRAGIQNGSPDGIALVDPMANVIEFLSYEGSFVAVDGPAMGIMSVDIGVSETSGTPIGASLQLSGGPGASVSDFSWVAFAVETPGAVNTGQSFTPPTPTGTQVFFEEDITPGDCPIIETITRTWTATDVCGNSTSHVQTIVVEDLEPPTFVNAPAAIDDIACGVPLPTPEVVTGADNCGGASVAFETIVEGSQCDGYLVTYRYTASDLCVYTTVADVTFNIGADTEAPEFDQEPLPESFEITCAEEVPEAEVLTATDVCTGVPINMVLFSEIHYDNAGGDVGEFFEISGPAGTDLSAYTVYLYNGNGGAFYDQLTLSGVIDDEGNGYGAIDFQFAPNGIQNGAPDGMALVMGGMVISFISYEGTFDAANGPAIGMTSTDIGVSQFSSNMVGYSLQLSGTGVTLADLVWGIPTPETPGDLNPGLGLSGQLPVDVIFTEEVIPAIPPAVLLGQDTVRRTWTTTDVCGNTNVHIQDIIVNPLPPEIFCPLDIFVNLDPGDCNDIVFYNIDASTECLDLTIEITQIEDLEFTSGDVFPIGTHTQTYLVTDGHGNTASCSFDIQIIEFEPNTNALTCNDHVTISLDESCELIVGADIILEGDAYVCYDKYLIDITDASGTSHGNIVNGNLVGQLLTVTVTDPSTGNTCWGTITAEDKIPPVIECPCSQDPVGVTGFTGTLDANSPIWTRPFVTGGNCFPSGTGVDVPYQTFDFYVDMVSNNTFEAITFTAPSGDSFMALYTAPFDPTQPCANLVAADDDGGAGFLSEITADLSAGVDYVLVMTTFNNNGNDYGDFEIAISGAAMVMTAAPVCEVNCLEAELILAGNVPAALRPTATDACDEPTVEILNIDANLEDCEGGEIVITWVATDGSGNTATCDQVFVVEPLDMEDLAFPAAYEGECDGSTSPTVTGYPTVDGIEIGEQTCNLFTAYWDKPITDCGGGTKIVRSWTVVDWCSQEVREGTQVIKLYDNEGPEMTCPANMEVGTDFWYCYANVSIPKPTVTDACGSGYTLSLSSDQGVVAAFGGNYTISELPLGVTTVTWTAIDDCDNESSCSFTITVEDDVPPVPNCDEHTIVSLTNDAPYGITLVSADVFDDGSYDNCSDVTFEARRMATCIDFDWTTAGACIDDVPNGIYSRLKDGGMGFAPCVPFACCDVAQGPIMIELKVTDAAGNENFCMVEIEVQDKLAPFIECPPNTVVSCDFWFDSEVVTGQRIPLDEDPMTRVFGTVIDAYEVHDDQSARQHIVINDPGNDVDSQPKDWGIDGWADDNCDVTLDVQITIEDDCSGDDLPSGAPDHAVRYIERRFTATDGQDNNDNCRQIIWVVDFDPFYIADEDCSDGDRNDGVKWPCDELYTTCPDEVGVNEPVIYDDNCSLVAVTYEDTRFDFVDGACYKILREWKVIDWCQYESSTGAGLWTYTQVIKVIDSDGPEFTNCPEGPVTLCAEDEGVSLPANNQVFLGEADPDHTYCSVHVKGSLSVEEFCSDYVIYDVKVYPFNGATYYQLVDKTQVSLDENGQAELPYDTEKSPVQAIKSDGLPYNSPFCGDYHKILWSVEDGCGNITTCEYLVRLEDCKQPTPVCVNGLSTVVMPVGGTVTIWASEYDVSSIDDCTHSDDLLFSFSGDTYQPSREWNCDNVDAFGAELSIEVWVADEGVDHNCNGQITWDERNKDFCTTTIVITDNDGVCGSGGNVIAGDVMTHADLTPVELTTISLSHPTNVFPSVQTIGDGKYTFTNVPSEGPLTIIPSRNDDHKNGVSTLDLVRIQKHLLGVEPFNNPYDYIAADANNNLGVSALDLVELRKLILGIYTELPNNSSWRFVKDGYEFADPSNPWPFDETIVLNDMSNATSLNFMGVKVGDVNNTVVSNATQVVVRGAREMIEAKANSVEHVYAGEEFSIEVTVPSELLGFQWTLDLNGMFYTGIESDQLGNENVGVHDGQLSMSYGRTVVGEPVIFKLNFEATKEGNPADMISVTNDITDIEAYSIDEEIMDMALVFRGAGQSDFALYQNEPNPFNELTVIGFDIPQGGEAILTVMDVTGKVIKVVEETFVKGYNKINLSRSDLPSTGVMYYRLDAGEFTATKKMIMIR